VNSFVAERRQREQLGLAMPQQPTSTTGWASADRNALHVGSIDVPAALLLTTTRSAAPAPMPDHVFRRRLLMGRSDICYNSPVVPPAPPGVMSAPPSPRYGVRLAAASAARSTQPSYTPSDLFWPHGDWPAEETGDGTGGTPGAGAFVAAANLASMSEPPSWPWRSLRPSIAVVLPKGFDARTAVAAAEEEAVAEALAVAAAVAAMAAETVMAAVAAAVAAVAAEPPAFEEGETVHAGGSTHLMREAITAHEMRASAVLSSSFAGRRPPSQVQSRPPSQMQSRPPSQIQSRPPSQMQSRAEASMMASGAAASSTARPVTQSSVLAVRDCISSSVLAGSPFAGSARLALELASSGAPPLMPPSPAPALLIALDRLSGEGMFGAAGSGWRGGSTAPRPSAGRGSARSEMAISERRDEMAISERRDEMAISERRNGGISSVIPSYNTGRAAKVYSSWLPSLDGNARRSSRELAMRLTRRSAHSRPFSALDAGCGGIEDVGGGGGGGIDDWHLTLSGASSSVPHRPASRRPSSQPSGRRPPANPDAGSGGVSGSAAMSRTKLGMSGSSKLGSGTSSVPDAWYGEALRATDDLPCMHVLTTAPPSLSLIRYGEAESDVLSSFARSGRLLAAAMRDEPEKELADLVRNDLAYEDLLTNLDSHRKRTADALAVHSAQLEQLRARLGSIARARRAIGDRTTPYVSRGVASAHTAWLGASVRAGHVCEFGDRIRQLRLAAAAVVEAVTEQRKASTEASVYALRVAVRMHASARVQRVAADARGAALTEGRAALEALTKTRPWLPLPLDVDPMVLAWTQPKQLRPLWASDQPTIDEADDDEDEDADEDEEEEEEALVEGTGVAVRSAAAARATSSRSRRRSAATGSGSGSGSDNSSRRFSPVSLDELPPYTDKCVHSLIEAMRLGAASTALINELRPTPASLHAASAALITALAKGPREVPSLSAS